MRIIYNKKINIKFIDIKNYYIYKKSKGKVGKKRVE